MKGVFASRKTRNAHAFAFGAVKNGTAILLNPWMVGPVIQPLQVRYYGKKIMRVLLVSGLIAIALSPCSHQDMVAYRQVERLRAASSQFADIAEAAESHCDPSLKSDEECQQTVVIAVANAEGAKDEAFETWDTITPACRDWIRANR